MRSFAKPIPLVSCLCFLMLQWSGLHVHANAAGYIGGPETSYTHTHLHHEHRNSSHSGASSGDHAAPASPSADHDYGDARDVSLFDKALFAFKLPLAILALVFLFAIYPLIRTLAGADVVYPVLSGRHTRWRPPLRAPPQTA